MNYHLTCSSAILCSFLATGCSTLTETQTTTVTETAYAYTDFLIKLLDKTKTKVIQMDTEGLVESRSKSSKKDNEKKLAEKDRELNEWVSAVNQLRIQNQLLQKYFSALDLLIKSPSGTEMSQTISSISLSISEINQAEADRSGKEYRNRTLTGQQTANVASLSETLISNHYAHKVKRVLIRDRNIIDKQIALHEEQLEKLAKMYKRRDRLASAKHLANDIKGPYISVSQQNSYDAITWADHRNQWFAREDVMTEFDDAKKAGEAFREAWRDILKGNTDVGAVNAILGKANNVVGNAYQLHNSYHNPMQPNPLNMPVMPVIPQTPQ